LIDFSNPFGGRGLTGLPVPEGSTAAGESIKGVTGSFWSRIAKHGLALSLLSDVGDKDKGRQSACQPRAALPRLFQTRRGQLKTTVRQLAMA